MEENLSLSSKDAVIPSNPPLNSTTTTNPNIESPDSAIGGTPPASTPDQPSPTTPTSTNDGGGGEGRGKLKEVESQVTLDGTERTSSDEEGYEEDDEGEEEEEELSMEEEEQLVVKASMQFPLAKKATPSGCESDIEDNDQEEEELDIEEVEEEEKKEEDTHTDTHTKNKEEEKEKEADIQADTHADTNADTHLPDTVTRLETSEGSAVYLVGTAHFSRESQEDVASTIRAVRPDVVVVELCKARTAILQLDEETILQESRSLDLKKVQMIMRQHGKVQGILYLLLLSVSAHITKQLGMAPGGEFRTAFAEARRSAPGCLIQLGDRPIQITLSRALASLSLWHKIKLTWHILTSKEPISKEEVEKCKQKDFILEMLTEMTGQFPAISEVFVKERDVYLCRSLQVAAQPLPGPGKTPRVVVGVVGIGHVPGIIELWGKVTEADIVPIMRIPPPTLSNQLLKLGFRMTLYGLAGYGLYRCLPRSTQTSIHSTIHSAIHSTLRSAIHTASVASEAILPAKLLGK